MLYFLFTIQSWLVPVTIGALAIASFASHRRHGTTWSFCYCIAAGNAMIAVAAHHGANVFGIESTTPGGGLHIEFHPWFRWSTLATQTLSAFFAVAGSAAIVFMNRGSTSGTSRSHDRYFIRLKNDD